MPDAQTPLPAEKASIEDMLRRLDELPTPGEIEERDTDVIPERPGL